MLGMDAIIKDYATMEKKNELNSECKNWIELCKLWLNFFIETQYSMRPTPFRPIYSEICPLAIAPTIAPTLDKDPKTENYQIVSNQKSFTAFI